MAPLNNENENRKLETKTLNENESKIEEGNTGDSEAIQLQLKQIENLTNKQLNKYFDEDINSFINNINNNKSFEFEQTIYSSSEENLTQIKEFSDENIENDDIGDEEFNKGIRKASSLKTISEIDENIKEEDENNIKENKNNSEQGNKKKTST